MRFTFNKKKNDRLKAERKISFEEIIESIANDGVISEITNSEKYPHQKVFLILVNNYVWAVPFIEKHNETVLVTAFPSRKYTKKYLKGTYEKK